MIARIYPVMTVYTVKGGQRKGSKHVINFPQNVSRLAAVLPQLPVDIPLIVRRSDIHETKHYDFRVRQHKIRDALQWLKENNKWYRDITISDERLAQLPTNANLEDRFWRRIVDNPHESQMPASASEERQDEDRDINDVMGYKSFALDLTFRACAESSGRCSYRCSIGHTSQAN